MTTKLINCRPFYQNLVGYKEVYELIRTIKVVDRLHLVGQNFQGQVDYR